MTGRGTISDVIMQGHMPTCAKIPKGVQTVTLSAGFCSEPVQVCRQTFHVRNHYLTLLVKMPGIQYIVRSFALLTPACVCVTMQTQSTNLTTRGLFLRAMTGSE